MKFSQLKYFLVVAEEGQITTAAAKLHMTQPPLSQQLKQLEDSLGVKLFNRTAKGIELTAAGRLLYTRGSQILTMVDNTTSELRDFAHGTRGTVHIGIISSAVSLLLRLQFDRFCAQNPHVGCNLIESDTFSVLNMLDRGIVEVAFVRTPFSAEGHNVFPLFSEPVVAIASHNYRLQGPLYTHDPTLPITLDLLAEENLILLQNYEDTVLTAFRQQGVEPNIICRGSNATVALLCARAGAGIMLTPKNVLDTMASNDLLIWDVSCSALTSSLCVVWKQDCELSYATERFISHIKSQFPNRT